MHLSPQQILMIFSRFKTKKEFKPIPGRLSPGTLTNYAEVVISIQHPAIRHRHPKLASCRFPFGSAWVQHDTN